MYEDFKYGFRVSEIYNPARELGFRATKELLSDIQ